MIFTERLFSKRFPAVTCAIFVVHEPDQHVPTGPKHGIISSPDNVVYRNGHRATAAAVILPSGSVYVGVAVCSPNDQFIKAVGRQKAIGRAFQAMHDQRRFAYACDIDTELAILELKALLANAITAKKREIGLL